MLFQQVRQQFLTPRDEFTQLISFASEGFYQSTSFNGQRVIVSNCKTRVWHINNNQIFNANTPTPFDNSLVHSLEPSPLQSNFTVWKC